MSQFSAPISPDVPVKSPRPYSGKREDYIPVVKSGQVKSGWVKSKQVKSGQIKSGQANIGQVKLGQVGQVRKTY